MVNVRRFSAILSALLTACAVGQLTVSAATIASPPAKPAASAANKQAQPASEFAVTREYNAGVLERVDKLVRSKFYDKQLMQREWPRALDANREKILASKTLAELSARLNEPIKSLGSSHCQFVTSNDETFYFLHSLFNSYSRKKTREIDFTGAITGGVGCSANQVRYVLDGSPAAAAGILSGDRIETVNGKKYAGESSFWNTGGTVVELSVVRNGQPQNIQIKPVKTDCYKAYVNAIGKSLRITKLPQHTIGYLRLWCGGHRAHDAFEDALSDKNIQATDGLIVDLRDGYGGNYFNDLDYFYRPSTAYPRLITGEGKDDGFSALTYDKPLVFLINGGSRSGKELLAYSLKKTGRAKLVGETTAGAVLAGQLFPIDNRCALYLAVRGGTVDGIALEGKGVAPDIEVKNACGRTGNEKQLSVAESTLAEMLNSR